MNSTFNLSPAKRATSLSIGHSWKVNVTNDGSLSYCFHSRIIYGSVWIGLILLKLKTYCWNHCSKIIFKCVNSIVEPIFNEKVAKKWNLWVYKQYTMHCLRQKSQHLRLLFIEQYMNSNRVLPKRVKKKKNAKRRRVKRNIQTNAKFPFNTIIKIYFETNIKIGIYISYQNKF